MLGVGWWRIYQLEVKVMQVTWQCSKLSKFSKMSKLCLETLHFSTLKPSNMRCICSNNLKLACTLKNFVSQHFENLLHNFTST